MSKIRKVYLKLNAAIRKGYWFNNTFFPECRKFEKYYTFNTEVINLGSSSSVAAFNYDGLPVKAANFALSRNPLLGDLGILKNYSSFLREGTSTVIIPLCPFSSLAGSYDYLDDRYYRILYPTTIPYYSYIHQVRVQEKWNDPIKYYPWYAPFLDFYKLIVKNKKEKVLQEDRLEKNAETYIRSWLHEFSMTDFNTPLSLKNKDGIDDAAEILNQMIDFCKEHGFKPVIVIPPVYRSLSKRLTKEARTLVLDSLIEKLNDKSVPFYNYLDDPQFVNDRMLFQNSFFLNKKGAKLFTYNLLKELNIIG